MKEPKNWELAVAIEKQIESYKNAARVAQMTEMQLEALTAKFPLGGVVITPEIMLEHAQERLSEPIIDLDAITPEYLRAIGAQGGWERYTRAE